MVSRAIRENIHSLVFQRLQIALVLRTVLRFCKTHSCMFFFQIALETILLLIYIYTSQNSTGSRATYRETRMANMQVYNIDSRLPNHTLIMLPACSAN